MRRLLILFLLAALAPFSHAIEEPDYEVVRTLAPDVELRDYAPYVVAEVVLDAAAEDAGNQAFPILAGYIFGKNKGERKFAMTAPVTQAAAEPAPPMRMAMTAPVTQTASRADGGAAAGYDANGCGSGNGGGLGVDVRPAPSARPTARRTLLEEVWVCAPARL